MQRKLFFLACFFIYAAASAQQYPFIYYTPKDGLANSRVRSIRQDSKGRMYFLTHGGLSVYDGTRFTNYHKENGLANELVNDLMEIAPDSFLVATNTNTLNTLVKGEIGLYKTQNNFSPVINRLLKSSEGEIYVAADDGLFLLEPSGFRRLPLLDDQNREAGLYLDKLMEWGNYIFILPWDQGGLMMFDKRTHKLKDILLEEKIFNLTHDQDGQIWISTTRGLKCLDQDALKNENLILKDIPFSYKKLIGNITGTVYFDKNGNCLISYGAKIHKVERDKRMVTLDASNGLEIGSINELFVDREGLIWMATEGNGAVKWKGTEIKMINSFSGKPSLITAITKQNDTVWLFNVADQRIHYFSEGGSGSHPVRVKDCHPHNIYIHDKTLYLIEQKRIIKINDKNNSEEFLKPSVFPAQANAIFGTGIMDKNGAIINHKTKDHNSFFISVMKNDRIIFEYPLP
ncbi:MAG: ligand-binding sensor domain-containing protein, partial [Flavisolibacter sp.]